MATWSFNSANVVLGTHHSGTSLTAVLHPCGVAARHTLWSGEAVAAEGNCSGPVELSSEVKQNGTEAASDLHDIVPKSP